MIFRSILLIFILTAAHMALAQPSAAQEDTAGSPSDTAEATAKGRPLPPFRAAFSGDYKLLAPSPVVHGKGESIGFHTAETKGIAPLFFLPRCFGVLTLKYRYARPLIYGQGLDALKRDLHTLGAVATLGFHLAPDLRLMVFTGAAMSGDYRRIDAHSFVPRLGAMLSWKHSPEWKFMLGLTMTTAYLYYIPVPLVGFSYARRGSPVGAALGPPGGINVTLRFVEEHVLRFGLNYSGGNWQIHPGDEAPTGVSRLRMIEVQAGIASFQKIAGPLWLGLELGCSLFSVVRTTDNYRTEYDWLRRKPAPYMTVSLLFVPPNPRRQP